MIARFTDKQPFVKINTIADRDYIYICINEREGTELIENLNYENVDNTDTESHIKHYYEYDYDEFSVPKGSVDYTDLNNNPGKYMYSSLRKIKYAEVSSACESTIYEGIDIELSGGVYHFSLTEKDQLNLFGIKTKIAAGATEIEYHSDGQPCKFYSVEDANKIADSAMTFVSYHVTYCNSLNMWIKNTTSEDELNSIYYGIKEIPEEYQSEVFKSYIKTKSVLK